MNTIERVMRVMTHLNIGATLATGAWIIGSGHLIFNGQVQPPRPRPAPAPQAAPATTHQSIAAPCCRVPTRVDLGSAT